MSEAAVDLQRLPLDHVAIAVSDLDTASRPYLLLGYRARPDELVSGQGVTVRMLEAEGSRLELLEPTSEDTPVGRFLQKRGAGLHHIGLRVESLEAEMERLEAVGAEFTGSPREGHGGTRVLFLHPRFAGGVLVELVEHSPGMHV